MRKIGLAVYTRERQAHIRTFITYFKSSIAYCFGDCFSCLGAGVGGIFGT